ncbi:MAG TPA: hypothetical protein VGM53_35415 [Streptosporangiaceae bacterium]|jgi:hypothetical protein
MNGYHRGTGQPAPQRESGRYPLSPGWQHHHAPAGRQPAGAGPGRARAVANRGHRHRYAVRPWIVLAAVTLAGTLAHVIAPLRACWWLFLLAGAGYAAWQWRKRQAGDDSAPAGQQPGRDPASDGARARAGEFGTLVRRHAAQLYAAGCASAAGGWLALVVACGLAAGPGRLAVAGLAVPGLWPLSWYWWQHHKVRPVVATPGADPDPVITEWAAYIGVPGGLYPGTRLTAAGTSPGARSYLVTGERGKHTTRQLTSGDAHTKIAGALGYDPERITLEKPPPGPDRNGVNARLVVVDARNPQLQARVAWQGPTLQPGTGLYQVGVYPDTPAWCRLYQVANGQPHRALNNAVAGQPGKGKSRFIDLTVAEMLHSGLFAVWYGDGQEGASGPGLRDHVDWYATRRGEILRMLKAAWRVAKARQRYDGTVTWTDSHGHRRTGRGFWPASPAEPFLAIILDECQELLKDPKVSILVRTLQRLGPKVGIGITLSTQEWLQYETGGASGDPAGGTIRTFAQTGNVVLLKAGSDMNANALGGLLAGVDPRALPDEPGWCYLLGAGNRPVPARLTEVAADDLYDWLHRARDIKARLDDLAAAAAGEGYATRWDRLAEITEASTGDSVLEDIEGELAELLGENQPAAAAPGTALAGMTFQQAVLTAVRDQGPIKREDIVAVLAAAGHTPGKSTIDQALASWKRTGHLISKGRGIWDIPDRADRADADAETRAAVLELDAHRRAAPATPKEEVNR